MKLNELLQQITPLPWDESVAWDIVHGQPSDNAQYATHCANVLPELVEALGGALHALRSYQYGNSAPDLAEEAADRLERVIAKSENIN